MAHDDIIYEVRTRFLSPSRKDGKVKYAFKEGDTITNIQEWERAGLSKVSWDRALKRKQILPYSRQNMAELGPMGAQPHDAPVALGDENAEKHKKALAEKTFPNGPTGPIDPRASLPYKGSSTKYDPAFLATLSDDQKREVVRNNFPSLEGVEKFSTSQLDDILLAQNAQGK